MNIKASQWFVVFVVARLDFSQWRTSLCFPSRRSHDGVQAPYHWLGGDEREGGRGGSKVGREIPRTTWTPRARTFGLFAENSVVENVGNSGSAVQIYQHPKFI